MRARRKESAALEGCEHGATEQGKAEKAVDYISTGDTSTTGATVEAAPAVKDRRPWLGRDRTEWVLQVSRHEATKLSSLRVAMQLALFADADGRLCRTRDEIGEALSMDGDMVRRAIKELGTAGHLVERRGRPSVIQLVIWVEEAGQSDAPNRAQLPGFPGTPKRAFLVTKPGNPVGQSGQCGRQSGQIVTNQAEKPNEINGPEKRLIANRNVGRVRKDSLPNSKSLSCTSSSDREFELEDDHTRAPDGACSASNLSSDEESPPDNDVPPEVRAQWDAEDFERYCNQVRDGEPPIEHMLPDHEPDPDIAPDRTATEDSSEGHAKAAHRPPVEDDDFIDFSLADEADEEPARQHDPQVTRLTADEYWALGLVREYALRDGGSWLVPAKGLSTGLGAALRLLDRKGYVEIEDSGDTGDKRVRVTADGDAAYDDHIPF